jgi:hypothetical protein
MTTAVSSAAVDCPACNASAESSMAIATVTIYGLDLVSSCCGFQIWQGSVIDRGLELSRAAILERIRAQLPGMTEADAFCDPWDHHLVLGLVPATNPLAMDPPADAHPDSITSVTIRFPQRRANGLSR